MRGIGIDDKRDIIFDKIKDQIKDNDKIEKLEELQDTYKDKSEDEIFIEIIRLNEEMEEALGKDQYNEIFDKLQSIRPYLTKEQNDKLDYVIKTINKNKTGE